MLPPLPPLVVEDYNWEASKTDPSIRQRRANGVEAIVGLEQSNAAGGNDLYLLSSVQFAANAASSSLTLSQLQAKVERVLVRLRFEHPEIAQTAAYDKGQPIAWIQYKPLKSNEDALAWAHELVSIRASPQTAMDIRDETEAKRQQDGGSKAATKPVVVYIAAPVAGLDAALGSANVEFVFHTNHLYSDGISTRIFAGDLFRYLGEELSSSSSSSDALPDYRWGQEIQNLGAPVLTMLKRGTELSGPKFDKVKNRHLGTSMRVMDNYGLLPKGNHGLPRTIFHTFTEQESDAIYKSVKSKLGPSGTPTHLGHAAVLLSLMKARPAPPDLPDTEVYVSQTSVNARRFFENAQQHATTYYAAAQSTCPIMYENLKQFNVVGASKETLNEYLLKAALSAKESYDKIIGYPESLVAGLIFHNLLAQLISTGDMPPKSVIAPIFNSDGINETYIPREVTDSAGNVVLSVNTVRFLLNQLFPWLSIRLDSWRGRSQISLNYCQGSHTDEDAASFLQDMASFMLQFTE